MLILRRRSGETLVIGPDVRITVLRIEGRQVCIGIAAPRNTFVHREEVYERIQLEKRRARAS